jgi:SAM-dependent methyltransferase
MTAPLSGFPREAFLKQDPTDDTCFYAEPRFVTHIDAQALTALSRFYATHLPPIGALLDLMSSHVSHLPASIVGAVTGHGMNGEELRANPRLQDWVVQNLNTDPVLPFTDATFAGAICCAGVQYLQRPDEVFAELARVLQPRSPCIVSFSNRCFPTKAVAIWRALDAKGHGELVSLYLERAGFERVSAHVLCDGSQGDPITAVIGYAQDKA